MMSNLIFTTLKRLWISQLYSTFYTNGHFFFFTIDFMHFHTDRKNTNIIIFCFVLFLRYRFQQYLYFIFIYTFFFQNEIKNIFIIFIEGISLHQKHR